MDNQPIRQKEMTAEEITAVFRNNVLTEMDRAGLTKKELAARAEVPQDQLYKFLNGRNKTITTGVAARIAGVFGLRLDDMLSVNPPATLGLLADLRENNPETLGLVEDIRELDPASRALVQDFLKMVRARKERDA